MIRPIGTPAITSATASRRDVEIAAVQRAVAGEHEDHEELGELAGLELERPDVEPRLRALHVARRRARTATSRNTVTPYPSSASSRSRR